MQRKWIASQRRWRLALAAGLLLGAAPLALAAPILTDEVIADAVDDELLFDPGVNSNRVDVVSREGVVTLSGTVDNILAKERAARVARAVRGVRAVINDVEVAPPVLRSDRGIRDDVRTALFEDPATEVFEVVVAVNAGVVTLSGTVDSLREKELAATVAKGVAGVREVVNQIGVDYKTTRAAAEIQADIEQALKWDIWVDHALIDVAVEGTEARLTGTVGSAAEKVWARYDAYVDGILTVDDSGLKVERWARDPDLRKSKFVVKSDAALEEAVRDALLYDPRVAGYKIDVDVAEGVVTLRGTVTYLRARQAAGQDARNTVGVAGVENRIKVRPDALLGSGEIESKIRGAFDRDPFLDSGEIGISVVAGVASLTGTVDTGFLRARAEDLAAGVRGVLQVDNRLRVEAPSVAPYDPYVYDRFADEYAYYTRGTYPGDFPPATFKSDLEILRDVNDELFWSPFVDGERITVAVDDGVVTLSGAVSSWAERDAATENAFEGGAIAVSNRLAVTHGE